MIREMQNEDIAAVIKAAKFSGLEYGNLSLESPLVINRIVSTRTNGTIIASGIHRICYETILVVQTASTPQEKWAALKEIDSELSTRAFQQGLDIVHAAVSPIGFDKRLLQLGWVPFPDGSKLWSRQTNETGSKSS